MPSKIKAVSLSFKEQEEFFKKKLLLPTNKWNDIYGAEHDFSFIVAGANRNDILSGLYDGVQKSIAGGTYAEFQKDFDRVVAQTGWSYKGGRNWRTRIIYETNINSAYMAGRYQQMMAIKDERPYWQYVHNDSVEHPRLHHVAWNGLILRWDDPWWQTHFPPNGWGCQCRVYALSEDDLQRMGLTVGTAPEIRLTEKGVPEGIDPSFEHIPGKARLLSEIPPEMPEPPMGGSTGGPGLPNTRPRPTDDLPPVRPAPETVKLAENLSPENFAEAFLEEFSATLDMPVIWKDVIGERVVIGKDLFTDTKGRLKSDKRGRGPYMKLLAQALKDPDEIWVRLEWQQAQKKNVVRRRYIARFQLPGELAPTLLVFEEGKNGWYGVTAFSEEDVGKVDDWRVGIRLYKRE